MTRLDWDTSWLLVAATIARRSRCVRYQTGTVLVDRRNRIVATGYIGPAAGFDSTSGTGYEECTAFCERARSGPTDATRLSYSDCASTHSELNALLVCDRRDREGGTIYVTSVPCWTCAKAIANSGVARAVVVDTSAQHPYRDPEASLGHLEACGIEVEVVDLTEDLTVDVQEVVVNALDNPFEVGDRVHLTVVPPGVADVTVTALGVCGDDGCTRPTILFADPESGEPDEAHADEFTRVP